ncbi:MAG TPA: potassium channel family protein [Bryobacteraceae bacterium]|nr:potassium channel family protein [Bryobacteraceae bacterium]
MLVRLTRIIRVLRVARLAGTVVRGTRGLREVFARKGLLYVFALSCFLIVAGGGALALLEPTTAKGGFGDGVWWAVVTASTVGYGDISPSTLVGRSIAVAMMLAGIGLVSTLSASITAHFVEHAGNTEMAELKERTARIERLLEMVLAERRAGDRLDGAAVPRR